MKQILRFFIFIILIFSGLDIFAQTDPTISICGNTSQFLCATSDSQKICIKIFIPAIYTNKIDKLVLKWGDNTSNITINGSPIPDTILHYYNLKFFYGTCIPDKQYNITLYTYITNVANPKIIIFPLIVINPPISNFSITPNPCCLGKAIVLTNNSCNFVMGSSMINYGDGSPVTSSLNHTYAQKGNYTISLKVSPNSGCNSDVSSSKTVEVLEKPIADIKPVSGFTSPALVCLVGGGTVNLDGESLSIDETTYEWKLPSFGVSFTNNSKKIDPKVFLNFSSPGTYAITLTVSNPCGATSSKTLNIKVVADEKLGLNKQSNACTSLSYTPTPFNTKAQYFIDSNPNPTTLFPVNFGVGLHTVKATLTNECGTKDTTITFSVVTPSAVTIQTKDTTVCINTANILLSAMPSGGSWSGTNVVSQGSYFKPIATGTFKATYSGNCLTQGSVNITVIKDITLNLQDEKDACEMLSYSPMNYNPNAIYVINGDTITTFPTAKILPFSNKKYYVTAYLQGNCGPKIAKDSFFIKEKFRIKIKLPDTTFCASAQKITLNSNFATTKWSFDNKPLVGNVFTFPNAKLYTIIAEGDCAISDTVLITVLENKTLKLSSQNDSCQQLIFRPILKDTTLKNVTYTVDEKVQKTFPITLKGSTKKYKIIATYTDFCGSQKDSISFNVFPRIKINIDKTVPSEICISKGNTTLLSDYPNTEWVVNGNKIQGNIFDVSNAIIGYNIIIARDITGCTTPDTLKIKVVDDKVKITAPNPICINATPATLSTLPNYKGIWKGDGIDPATGVFSPKIANQGMHQINYNYKIPNTACEAQDSVLIEVAAPDVSLPKIDCNGFIFTFELSIKGSLSGVYWDFGDGQNSTQNAPNVSHTYAQAGDYTVILKGILGNCDTTVTAKIKVEEMVVAAFMMPDSICENVKFDLVNKSAGSNLKYKWLLGNNVIGTDSIAPKNQFFIVNKDSTVVFSLEISNECGTSIYYKTLKIKALPKANLGTLLDKKCSGEKIVLLNTSFGGLGFVWKKDGVFLSNTPQLDTLILFTDNNETTYTYKIIATNTCGSDSISQKIVIKPTDVKAAFSINKKIICVGEFLEITSKATPFSPIKYVLGDGSTSNEDSLKYAYSNAGKYKIVQYVYGCGRDSSFAEITVLPRPTVTMKTNQPVCLNIEIVADVTTNGISLIHKFGDGDSTNTFDFGHFYANSGKFIIKTIATSQNGCKSTLDTPVEIYPLPIVDFTISNATPCENAPVVLNTNTSDVLYEYHSGNGNVGDKQSAIFYYPQAGTYNPYLIITDKNTCRDSLKKIIVVNPAPKAGFEVPTVNICPPVNLPVTDKSSGAKSYLYTLTNGAVSSATAPSFYFPQGGNFTIKQIVSNQTCADTLTKNFHIFSVPEVEIETIHPKCHGIFDGILNVNTKSNTDLNILEGKNSKYKQSGVNRFEGLKPGDYLLTVKSIDGCLAYKTVTIFNPDSIRISISNRDTIDIPLGGIDTFRIVTNKQKLIFIWNTEEGFINKINKQLIEISPKTDILYRLTAIDSNGCKATAQVFVRIDKKYPIFVPSIISANGDNINDNFTIFADIKVVQKVEIFKIFDRFGDQVFSNENFQPNIEAEGWDGNFRNEPVSAGVFTYFTKILFKDGTTHIFKGDMTLIR